MNTYNIRLGTILLSLAALYIGLSIPIIKRRIKMNHLYGVRIPKSFESEENWYKINAYGGKRIALWSSLLIPIGIAAFFIPFQEGSSTTIVWVLLVGLCPIFVLIPAIVEIMRFSKKL